MTDNDIIKALECCVHVGCIECQFDDTPCCMDVLHRHVLDLINRQKAEIERLKAMLEAAEDHYNPLPFKGIFAKKVEEAKCERKDGGRR